MHCVGGKTLLECSFLIPIRRDRDLSDGKLHRRAAWKWLEMALGDFGGATRAKHPLEGWYLDLETGKRVRDMSKKFYVALPRAEVQKLRLLLSQACAVFHQKCIYLSIAGRVEFIRGRKHET
jgi:hypothetical protein